MTTAPGRVAVIDETLLTAEEKMEKAVNVAKEEFAGLRTGRFTPQLFSKVLVDYYGSPTPVNQLASFHAPEPRMCVITPYDKSSLGAVMKAIRDSDLGVNPTDDGQVIRVVFPQLTEQRRKELVKVARHKAEEARVSIRAVRRHARTASTVSSRMGRPGRTRCAAPRRSSRTPPTATWSPWMTCSNTRRRSYSRSEPHEVQRPMSDPPDGRRRAGEVPAAAATIARVGGAEGPWSRGP